MMMMMTVKKIMMVMIMTVMVMIHSYDKERNDEECRSRVNLTFPSDFIEGQLSFKVQFFP